MPTGDQTGASLNEIEEESKERNDGQQPEAAGETGSQQSSQLIAAAAPSGHIPAPVSIAPLPLSQLQQSMGEERIRRTIVETRPQPALLPEAHTSISSRPDDAMSEHAASHRQIPSSIDAVE